MAVTEQEAAVPRPNARTRRRRRSRLDVVTARNVAQAVFALFILWCGWRFYLFVQHFVTHGAVPLVTRPASVEAFLPISALVSLHALLGAGWVDRTHPAALVLLLAIVAVSLIFKKAVCSWICPIGTLSEWLSRLGRRLIGRNLILPSALDVPLRGVKYLVLFFFLFIVVFGMSPQASIQFLQGEYNRVADVKMLYFFTEMGVGAGTFILAVSMASVFVSNAWCRYLCPYGAFVGLISLLSPLRIVRVKEKCIDCKLCTKACPNRIDVAKVRRVDSPECTSCLNCVAACPKRGALEIRPLFTKITLGPWTYGALALLVFFLIVVVAQLSGYWQTDLTYADFAKHIPNAEFYSH